MRISGQGITGYKTVHIKNDFIPTTILSLSWAQTASGSWVASDRGVSDDIYKTTITVYGREVDNNPVNDLLLDLYNNRVVDHADANKIFIDWIEEDEKIFGCDIDYSNGVWAKILDIGPREQSTLRAFSVKISLILLHPVTFVGTHAASIQFNHIDVGYVGDVDYTFSQNEILGGLSPHTADLRSDSGIIQFAATVRIADMITFRRTLAYQRSAPITTTVLKGVSYPFGPTRSNTWPKNLKYIQVKETGTFGQQFHRVQIKAVEDL